MEARIKRKRIDLELQSDQFQSATNVSEKVHLDVIFGGERGGKRFSW